MRIARWLAPAEEGRSDDARAHDVVEGIVVGDRMLAFPPGVTVQSVLESGLSAALELGARMAMGATGDEPTLYEVRLLAPLRPAAIRDFVAFEEHVEGMTAKVGGVPSEWYEFPTFYFSNPHSVVAPDGVVTPPTSEALDFELELAAVIGAPPRHGANLTAAEGEAAIFGYTIMNDWSARDLQNREMQVRLGPAKGKDFGTSLGPWLVTADELAGARDAHGFLQLKVAARINGVIVGEDLMSNMGWPFGELVAYASRNAHVVPGDVLGSGTAGNGGCLGELWGRTGSQTPPPLVAGDVVELQIQRSASSRNRGCGGRGAGHPSGTSPRSTSRARRSLLTSSALASAAAGSRARYRGIGRGGPETAVTDLRSVDVNLIIVLDALLSERSITAAASAVGLTQPAVSSALTRLRRLLDDPLIVRSGREFELTSELTRCNLSSRGRCSR